MNLNFRPPQLQPARGLLRDGHPLAHYGNRTLVGEEVGEREGETGSKQDKRVLRPWPVIGSLEWAKCCVEVSFTVVQSMDWALIGCTIHGLCNDV